MKKLLLILLVSVTVYSAVFAAPSYCPDVEPLSPQQTLRIGTKFSPPFVMGQIASLKGVSVDLWRLLADCMALESDQYQFIEYGTTNDLIIATQNAEVDLAIAAISVTPERETMVDFSHRYFQASLGTLVANRDGGANFSLLLAKIFRSNLLNIVFGLLSFMVIVAIYYWWTERQKGNEFFAEGPLKGFYRSLIWSTLLVFQGRGDPFLLNTRFGQLFVLFLMFFGVTIISSFTAVITSSLTLQALEPQVTKVSDLNGKTVAVKNLSVAADWAADNGIFVEQMQTFPQVQRKFDEGTIDAFVHDREILQYLVNTKALVNVKLAPLTMEPQDYAIIVPEGSDILEPINRSLLTILQNTIWMDVQQKYLGN